MLTKPVPSTAGSVIGPPSRPYSMVLLTCLSITSMFVSTGTCFRVNFLHTTRLNSNFLRGFLPSTFLPIDSLPSGGQRISDRSRSRSRRDRAGKLERATRRGAGRPLLVTACLGVFQAPNTLWLLPAAIHCLSRARERVANFVGAGV